MTTSELVGERWSEKNQIARRLKCDNVLQPSTNNIIVIVSNCARLSSKELYDSNVGPKAQGPFNNTKLTLN